MKKILLSQHKLTSLKKELEWFKKHGNQHIIKTRQDAGILQSFRDAAAADASVASLEERKSQLEKILKQAKVLPDKIKSDKVVLGSWVELENEEEKITRYRIVHPIEAEPAKKLISLDSPLGKLLKGRKEEEEINFNDRKCKIIKIF